jgi:hypothetical protein
MILTGENGNTRKKNLFQCHFVHHKSHTYCPGLASNCVSPWHGPFVNLKFFKMLKKN